MSIEFLTKPGLVVYLTAGDPDLATTRDIALAAIDNGADVIELGVPFSDPLADGPVIQRASERAVAKGVRLSDVKTGESRDFECEGVFIAIGHKPNTDLFRGQLDMDEVGYLKTSGHSTATNIPGVFACGDVQDSVYRQAVTAAGTGCMSAIDAERFLDHLPVEMPDGEEVTMEGEHITKDHKAIVMPSGEVVSNEQ